jgi:uncharacterized protein YndB with AHSA1/START domain
MLLRSLFANTKAPREESASILYDVWLDVAPAQAFKMLMTPSAIRSLWGTARSILTPRKGGIWVLSWGHPDNPDYVFAATVVEFEPPRKMTLKVTTCFAKNGLWPFESSENSLAILTITPDDDGSNLRIEQRYSRRGLGFTRFLRSVKIGRRCATRGVNRR